MTQFSHEDVQSRIKETVTEMEADVIHALKTSKNPDIPDLLAQLKVIEKLGRQINQKFYTIKLI